MTKSGHISFVWPLFFVYKKLKNGRNEIIIIKYGKKYINYGIFGFNVIKSNDKIII